MTERLDIIAWAESVGDEVALLRRRDLLEEALNRAMRERPVDHAHLLELARELGEVSTEASRAEKSTQRHIQRRNT